MDTATRVQILVKAVSHTALMILEKCMSPTILPQDMGEYKRKLDSLIVVCQSVKKKENSEVKPINFR